MSEETKQELISSKTSSHDKKEARRQRLNSPDRQKFRRQFINWLIRIASFGIFLAFYAFLTSNKLSSDFHTVIAWLIAALVLWGVCSYLLNLIFRAIDSFILPFEEIENVEMPFAIGIAVLWIGSLALLFLLGFIIVNLTPILLNIFISLAHQDASSWLAIIGIIGGVLGIVGGGGLIGIYKNVKEIQDQKKQNMKAPDKTDN